MQRKREGLAPIGAAPLRYGRPREGDPQNPTTGAAGVYCARNSWSLRVIAS